MAELLHHAECFFLCSQPKSSLYTEVLTREELETWRRATADSYNVVRHHFRNACVDACAAPPGTTVCVLHLGVYGLSASDARESEEDRQARCEEYLLERDIEAAVPSTCDQCCLVFHPVVDLMQVLEDRQDRLPPEGVLVFVQFLSGSVGGAC